MDSLVYSFLVLTMVLFASRSYATLVQPCDAAIKLSSMDNRVYIAGCEAPPCILRRNSTSYIEINFWLDYEVSQIITSVYAYILTIPFPYLGLDGSSACNHIWAMPQNVKVSCPLRRNQLYTYKNSFEIKPAYPKVKMTIHWALRDKRTNADIMCFEVPVKII